MNLIPSGREFNPIQCKFTSLVAVYSTPKKIEKALCPRGGGATFHLQTISRSTPAMPQMNSPAKTKIKILLLKTNLPVKTKTKRHFPGRCGVVAKGEVLLYEPRGVVTKGEALYTERCFCQGRMCRQGMRDFSPTGAAVPVF